MNLDCIFFAMGNLLLLSFLQTWWFKLSVLLLLVVAAAVFHWTKLKALKHAKADLERQLIERKELHSYCIQNEQRARKEAEQANTNKSELISKISHEIRTPMNAVLGMAALLNDTSLNTEQRGYLSTIMNSGESLLTTINEILMDDILKYSKVESGSELEAKDFDLRSNIEEVLDVFAAKSAKADIDLSYFMSDNVPVQIVGDAFRLRQILMNLLENAFRFTTKGEICIKVQNKGLREENRLNLEFEVSDTGAGITPARMEQVNKDLQQDSLVTGSIGLALNMCKKLVGLMGGSIMAESREGEGATFRFTIFTTPALVPTRNNTLSEMAGLEGKRILVTARRATVRNMLSNQLKQWKLTPFTAASGKEALEILAQNAPFDLLLSDIKMGDTNAVELAGTVKNLYPSLPVILLNKIGDESFKQHADLFRSVLNKPVRQHVLCNQIRGGLSQNRNPSLSEEQNYKEKVSKQFSVKYPLSILIAEDNLINQEFILRFLSKLGYTAQIANNGQEVLEVVSQKRYDLILMDVQMPKMNGLEATRMIRLCLSEQPYIIALTANNLQGDRDECLRAGMDDYISKPINLQELVSLLEKCATRVNQKS